MTGFCYPKPIKKQCISNLLPVPEHEKSVEEEPKLSVKKYLTNVVKKYFLKQSSDFLV